MNSNRYGRWRSVLAGRSEAQSPLLGALNQGATPASDGAVDHLGLPEGQRTYTMFVQTASGGTWAAKDGEEGVYTLTLTGVPAQTVYFSDRPERIVGTQSTLDFLGTLGFVPDNPPNAALVTTTDGAEDVLVIELFNPVYTAGEEPTLTYDARVLENYQEAGLAYLADRQGDLTMPAAFDAASLFIDDCADGKIACVKDRKNYGEFNYGCCYKFPACFQCHDPGNICDSIAGCENGQCTIEYERECYLW